MSTTIRSGAARVNVVVGPLVMLIGLAAGLAGIVLSIVLATGWFLLSFLPALLALGGGLFILRGARRSRLEIDGAGITWCGFVGTERSLRWEQLHQLVPPPPGRSRTVAVAQLRDGRQVPIQALWVSPTSPAALLGGDDHHEAQQALLTGHRAWLAAQH